MAGPVRSVSQAFAILRQLADAPPLSLSDIGRQVGLSPSSCLNLLKTLVDEGAVERDARSKRYRLTPGWAAADVLRDSAGQQLVERAQPMMAELARDCDAAVGLWRAVSRDRMQLIAHAESNAGMRLRLADAQRQPLGGGAAGRALAAAQAVGAGELARRHAAVRWQVPLPFAEYARQVARAAERGFAVDRGTAHRDIATVAVAIADISPGFCLSASVLAGSRDEAGLDALGERLDQLRTALIR